MSSQAPKRNHLLAWALALHGILSLLIQKLVSLSPAEPKGKREFSLCTVMPKGMAGSLWESHARGRKEALLEVSVSGSWQRYGLQAVVWGGELDGAGVLRQGPGESSDLPQKRPQSLRFSLMMMSVTASKTNLTFCVSVAHVMWE